MLLLSNLILKIMLMFIFIYLLIKENTILVINATAIISKDKVIIFFFERELKFLFITISIN